jgi:hypothetical protein
VGVLFFYVIDAPASASNLQQQVCKGREGKGREGKGKGELLRGNPIDLFEPVEGARFVNGEKES